VNVADSRKIIFTNRFILRLLKVTDVTERYAQWLSDQTTSKFISSSPLNLHELRRYVLERCDRDDILFFGIFDKITGLHIGNIKYEPINSELRYAIVGILIGSPEWRGRGVATEVLSTSADWLHQYRNIEQIVLGVSRSNVAAIRAYQKAGFVEQSTVYIPNVSIENSAMVLHLKTL
jgi:ribosomal-protein-alanine N-acetyltransferase